MKNKKIYLSFSNQIQAAAALAINDDIVEFVQEERFNRKKMYRGFPYRSIKYLLSKYKINPKDINKIIYCYADKIYPKNEIKKNISLRIDEGLKQQQYNKIKYNQRLNSEIKLQKKLFSNANLFLKKFKLSKKN